MTDECQNPDFAAYSGSELLALICQTAPVVMTCAQACQELVRREESNQSPCTNCDKHDTCKGTCELVEALLPGVHAGASSQKVSLEKMLNAISSSDDTQDTEEESPKKLGRKVLKKIDKVRSDEIFTLYKNCSFIFTPRQWQVITLKVDESHTYKEIGIKLGIATSTVSDTFKRAEKKLENYYRKKADT